MIVGEDLHLDVTRMQQITLQVDVGIAKRALRRPAAGFKRRGELLGAFRDPHADPAAAGGRLDHHREAEAFRLGGSGPFVGERGRSRHHGDAGRDHSPAGLDFVPHRPHAGRRRTDEGQAVARARLREGRVLRQKAIAGMDGVRAMLARHRNQLLDVEIGLPGRRPAQRDALVGEVRVGGAGIGLRVDRDRRDAHLAAGPHDTKGDLAAVRDQDFGDASQSSSTLRSGRRSLPLWRRPRAPFRRRLPRCRSASSSPRGRRPRRRGAPDRRARP